MQMSNAITKENYEVKLDIDLRFIINNSVNTEDFKEAIYIVCIQRLNKKYKCIQNFPKVLRDKINLLFIEIKEDGENTHFHTNKSPTQDTEFVRSWDYHQFG